MPDVRRDRGLCLGHPRRGPLPILEVRPALRSAAHAVAKVGDAAALALVGAALALVGEGPGRSSRRVSSVMGHTLSHCVL